MRQRVRKRKIQQESEIICLPVILFSIAFFTFYFFEHTFGALESTLLLFDHPESFRLLLSPLLLPSQIGAVTFVE